MDTARCKVTTVGRWCECELKRSDHLHSRLLRTNASGFGGRNVMCVVVGGSGCESGGGGSCVIVVIGIIIVVGGGGGGDGVDDGGSSSNSHSGRCTRGGFAQTTRSSVPSVCGEESNVGAV